LTIGVPCRADEPALGTTLASLRVAAQRLDPRGEGVRYLICVNGSTAVTPALATARGFAESLPAGAVGVFTDATADKTRAWNRIRAACTTPLLALCDADVTLAEDALERLVTYLEANPAIKLASARRVPELDGATFVARAAALPSRFDFHVVIGALYVVRTAAIEAMPEGLLFEDTWLSARLGRSALATVALAEARYRPPATLRDYFRERLRTEAGKVQIRRRWRVDGHRGSRRIAVYPWRAMWRGLLLRDWPLVLLNLGVRFVARAAAEVAAASGRSVAWRLVPSSKSDRVVQADAGGGVR
jgi:hypothetical protein